MNFRKWFTRKKVIWGIVILVVILLIGWRIVGKDKTGNVVTEQAKTQDLKATVLATGQVTSNTDLSLSFKASGIVRRVNSKVGDKVKSGQLIANLDQRDQLAALTSARGSLAAAQANYKKILDGASSEEVAVAQKSVDAAQVNLDNTKAQQDILVANAYRTLLSTGLSAEAANGSTSDAPTVTGLYGGLEGYYRLTIFQTGDGNYFNYSGVENGQNSSPITAGVPQALGTKGLYVTFPVGYSTSGSWNINNPNKNSTYYLSNYNSYQSALNTKDSAIKTAQASLDSAIASLNLKKAQARPADVQGAQAQILSASGQVQTAQAALESTEIRAAADGTITKIDIKVGELASAQAPVVVLQDVGNLYLEANVSEANISIIKPGQSVDVTFDALGPDLHYTANVLTVDPSSTVVSGVVNYKIKAALTKLDEIKPGMTANMTILTGEKPGVLAVPSRAIISHDNKKFVRIITDPKKKLYTETEIQTGFEADGGLVEVTSGLNAGQEIVTFIK